MRINFLSSIAVITLTSLMMACGSAKTTEFTYTFTGISMQIAPPVTPGPNTLQAELILNLDSVFSANKADRTKIKDVSVESMDLSMPEGRDFNNFESVVVNFFSDKNNMTKLASLSPVPENSSKLTIPTSEKADIHKYFSENSMFLIIDANMTEMDTLGYNVSMNMTLKFKAVEKK